MTLVLAVPKKNIKNAMGFKPNIIRIKAMCLINDGNRILVGGGFHDKLKKQNFYRVLGGSVEFGETSEQGVRREMREELNCEIDNLKFLEIIENIFTYEGMNGHEIVFMYSGQVSNKELEKKDIIHVIEPEYEMDAFWVPIDDILNKKIILCPEADYKKLIKMI